MAIQDVILPYPDFIMGEVIDSEQFDLNNSYTVGKINELLVVLNQITDSAETGSGADLIDITPVAPFTSKKLQTYLNEVINRLKSTTAGSSGAGLIGAPPIAGVTGSTISAQLASLKALLDTEVARINALTTRTTTLEGRATTVEGRATAVEGRATTLEGKMVTVEGRATALETRATNLEGRATNLEQNKANKADVYTKTEENVLHNALQADINAKGALITSIQNQINSLNDTFSTDAERVAAIQAVIDAYELSDSELSALILNKADRNMVYTKAEIDGMSLGSYKVVNYEARVDLASTTNKVEINIPDFDLTLDAIDIYVGGTYQTKGNDISVTSENGKNYVTNLKGTWLAGTAIDFVATKNTKVLLPSDEVNADLVLIDGTLSKRKLDDSLKAELDGKAKNSDLITHELDNVSHVTQGLRDYWSAKIDQEHLLENGVDLDTVLSSGFYRIQGAAVNAPPSNAYSQMIVSRGSDTFTQIVFPYSTSGGAYIRSGIVSAPSTYPWVRLLNQYDYDALFQFANDGKTAVANAVTAKGVAASPADTFPTLATKIGQIKTGKNSAKLTGSFSGTPSWSVNIPITGVGFVPRQAYLFFTNGYIDSTHMSRTDGGVATGVDLNSNLLVRVDWQMATVSLSGLTANQVTTSINPSFQFISFNYTLLLTD